MFINYFIDCKNNIIRNYFTHIPQEIAYSKFLRGRHTSLNENQLLVYMYVCYFKQSFSFPTDQTARHVQSGTGSYILQLCLSFAGAAVCFVFR
jgi:hypothetical protein